MVGLVEFAKKAAWGLANSAQMSPQQSVNHIVVDASTPPEGMTAYQNQQRLNPWQNSVFDGNKFPGGMGPTQLYRLDYWTMRELSGQLFRENMYALGLLKRLVTNEINTGLSPEMMPDEETLGMGDGTLGDWTDIVENRFSHWAENPNVCDYYRRQTFAQLQAEARMESLIDGDVLVMLRPDRRTGLPAIQLISGNQVQTPLASQINIPEGHKVEQGVQLDANNRHYGYWVRQKTGDMEFIRARGQRSGRRLAWLIYGSVKRLDDVRGTPLLAIILQSLKEIDRYRDSTQRQAWLASILVGWVEKKEDRMGSLPLTGGAVRREEHTITDNPGDQRQCVFNSYLPGVWVEEMANGEEIKLNGGQGTDVNFGQFEEAMIQGVAWAMEVPPEILRLAFSNNYSASQAAINEFKIYLNKVWSFYGRDMCRPVFVEWMVSETLRGNIDAPEFLQAWRDPAAYAEFGAWTAQEWYGSIKPSTDLLKQARGSELFVKNGWSTNAREARINTGTKFDRNVKRLKRENEKLVEALRPMAEFRQEMGALTSEIAGTDAIEETLERILEIVAGGESDGGEYG